MTTALITGSHGFVGPYLRAELEKEGMSVVGFDLQIGGDIRDYESIRFAIDTAQPDYVFHLAAQAYVPEAGINPARAIDVNVNGTLNLLEAVRNTGYRPRILLAGTSEEYGYDTDFIDEDSVCAPTTPYGVTKLAASHLGLVYAKTYGMNVVVTRAFNHTGPAHQPVYAIPSFAKRVAESKLGPSALPVKHGNLESVRNYTDVRDVVRAYRHAIAGKPGIYNVCSEHSVSLHWVLHKLIELAGCEIETEQVDALTRPGSSVFPNTSATKLRYMGWTPEIPIEQTLADTLAYWEGQVC